MTPKMNIAIIIASLLVVVAPTSCLNVATYNTIVNKMNAMLSIPGNIQPAPLHAKFVRLTFHDCTGPNGCDGCINLDLQDNNGLQTAVSLLEGFYTGVQMKLNPSSDISRADLWALAGLLSARFGALRAAPPGAPPPVLPAALDIVGKPSNFKFGRKDCATAPKATDETSASFPSSQIGTAATLDFFTKRFGFNAQQTVAIMGAHSLGRAVSSESGNVNGQWVPRNDAMGNDYYRQLVTPWNQVAASTSRPPNAHQWQKPNNGPQGPPVLMMLNPDISLVCNISPDNNGKVANQRTQGCPQATATFGNVQQYSNNPQLWLTDFGAVYSLMLNRCGNDAKNNNKVISCVTAALK